MWRDAAPDTESAAPDHPAVARVTAAHLDPDVVARAHAALDEHWALRSLRRSRREEIVAAAERRRDPAATSGDTVDAARSSAGGRGTRGKHRGAGSARARTPALSPAVSDADILHLAGAYDLAGRDVLELLRELRRDTAGAGALDEVSALDGADTAAAEHWQTLRTQLTIVASRAFILQTALPMDEMAVPTVGDADRDMAGLVTSRDDLAAAEALLHRLLHLAALAEIGHRRGDWLRWLDARSPTSGAWLDLMTVGASSASESAWELRFRSLVVSAWIQLLRRSGPSGLDDAMAMLAQLREERLVAEASWLAAVEREGDDLALVRARFRLFALSHIADAAVDTLLYLRHGPAHATATVADRAVQLRLNLAREAGAGDVQLDGVLTWLGEAARHVIARGSTQLEIAVGP